MRLINVFTALLGICCYITTGHAAGTSPVTKPMLTTVATPPIVVGPPPLPDAKLSVWANEFIITVYTFDNNNAEDNLKNIAKYFTADGWPVFLAAVNDSKILDTVKKNNYQVTAVAQNPPRIKALGEIHNKYTWTIVMPTLVSYHNKFSQFKQYLDITLTVVYTEKSGIRGLSVTQFLATQKDKPTLCQCN